MYKNMQGTVILRSEIRSALTWMKSNKAAGPDKTIIKILTALNEFRIDKIIKVINEIYDRGKILAVIE